MEISDSLENLFGLIRLHGFIYSANSERVDINSLLLLSYYKDLLQKQNKTSE